MLTSRSREESTLITKPEQHDIDQEGNRLLRAVLESFGWVVNDTQRDYGVDSNVQIFDKVGNGRLVPCSA